MIKTQEEAAHDRPYLSVVVPAFNEAARIEKSIAELSSFARGFSSGVEILLVIEKSDDDSLALARRAVGGDPAFRIMPQEVHRGKGYAVRQGMLAARGRFAFFMDADLSTPLSEIPRFLNRFEASPRIDILIGDRRHSGSTIIRRQPWLRRLMGRVFNSLVRSLTAQSVRDTQCGFKAFRSEAVRPVFSRQCLDGFSFDVEVLSIASQLKMGVRSLPVHWANAPGSKVRVVRDSLRMLFDLLLIWGRRHGPLLLSAVKKRILNSDDFYTNPRRGGALVIERFWSRVQLDARQASRS